MLRAIGSVVMVIVIAGCASSENAPTTSTTAPAPMLNVVATTTQIGDWVRVIGGDQVRVETLVAPGQSVSTYAPTSDDITTLARADMILRSGAGLDPWLEAATDSDARAVTQDMSTGIGVDQRIVNGQLVPDPFYWMSPVNARIAVANVTDALSERDPGRSDFFRTNERAYSAQLDSLRRNTERTLSSRIERKLVTARNDFGYYAKEFDLDYVGAVDSVPRDELVARIRNQGIEILVLSSVGSATDAYAVANAAGIEVVGGADVLYGESLGTEGSGADTYIEAMKINADVLVNSID